MKKIIAAAALMLMAATGVNAQTKRVMTVVQKDGTTTQYKVKGVERVTFTDVELPSLRNQIAFDDDVQGIDKVTMLEAADSYTFGLYTAEADTANAVPTLTIVLPKDSLGKQLTLGTDGESAVVVKYKGQAIALQGSLQVRFGRTGQVVVNLETETEAFNDLRCRYTSNYSQVFEATNLIGVEKEGADTSRVAIRSAFVVKPATTGEATAFAFGDATGNLPDSLVNGTMAVAVSISASKLYGDTIDMAIDKDSYKFQYYDYGKREVYDKVTAGTIVTKHDAEDNLYIDLVATLDDGRTVSVNYYGAVTAADSLDGMKPAPVAANEYKYYNADGELKIDSKLGTSYIDTDSKGNTTFYLVPDGDSKFSSSKVVLKVSEDLINAGEVQLADLGQTAYFDLKFSQGGIGLQSYAAGHGYGNTPDNGTMTVSKAADGTYTIAIDVYNNYNSPWSTKGGDNTHLVLNYTGTFEKY